MALGVTFLLCTTSDISTWLPHQLGHLNYNPLEVGEFEFYRGTKYEVAALTGAGKPLDPATIVAANMPGPGYAVLPQGNMMVHRANECATRAMRIQNTLAMVDYPATARISASSGPRLNSLLQTHA
jgi:hypothetical protein